jgi:hypothetical protein
MSFAMVSKEAIAKRAAVTPGYAERVNRYVVKSNETHVFIPRADYEALRTFYGAPPPGPGTELKALLATIGIVASPTCKCNKMAKKMDEWGQESLHHIEEIVDVMEETAKKRKLPFLRTACRTLVRIACWKAKRKGNGK